MRIFGAIIGGITIIWLGVLIANPEALVNPANPLGVFSALGAIIVVGGISAILVGVGWSLQTWGVGLILSFDRGE